jgi:hypothetical protein
VFHSPQAGHLPIHFGLSFPHSLQNHTVFVFTVAIRFICLTDKYTKRYCPEVPDNIFYQSYASEDYSQQAVSQVDVLSHCCSHPSQAFVQSPHSFASSCFVHPSHSALSPHFVLSPQHSVFSQQASLSLLLQHEHDAKATIAATIAIVKNTFFIVVHF